MHTYLAMLTPEILPNFGIDYNNFFSTCSYKKLMSLKITDNDRPKISLKFSSKGIILYLCLRVNVC